MHSMQLVYTRSGALYDTRHCNRIWSRQPEPNTVSVDSSRYRKGRRLPSSQPHQNPNDTTAIALKHEQKPGLPHSDRKRGRLPPDHMCRAVLVGPQRRLDSAGYGIHNRGRRFTKTTCTFDDVRCPLDCGMYCHASSYVAPGGMSATQTSEHSSEIAGPVSHSSQGKRVEHRQPRIALPATSVQVS